MIRFFSSVAFAFLLCSQLIAYSSSSDTEYDVNIESFEHDSHKEDENYLNLSLVCLTGGTFLEILGAIGISKTCGLVNYEAAQVICGFSGASIGVGILLLLSSVAVPCHVCYLNYEP